jgi:hypothetical protein
MNKSIFLLFLLSLASFSCRKEPEPEKPYSEYIPSLITQDEMRKLRLSYRRTFEDLGQIMVRGNMVYVVDKYEGIHTINLDHSSMARGFMTVPGCTRLQEHNGRLFSDRAVDLVELSTGLPYKSILSELLPPDRKGIPPSFRRGARREKTEIFKWSKY